MSRGPSAAGDEFAEASIDVEAEVGEVWRALITDGGLEPWMGEGATIEPVPNGALAVPDIVGGGPRHGLVERVDEHERLEFCWWPEQRPIERSRVCITLVPIETGTRVTVVERPTAAALRTAPHASARHRSPASPSAMVARSTIGLWTWRLAVLALAARTVRF